MAQSSKSSSEKSEMEKKVERQMEIERIYRERSKNRSKSNILRIMEGGNTCALPKIKKLVQEAHSSVYEHLQTKCNDKRTVGYNKAAMHRIKSCDLEVLATAGLITCFNAIGKISILETSVANLCRDLGVIVQSEMLISQLEAHAPAYLSRALEYIKENNTHSQTHIMRTMRSAALKVNFLREDWSQKECFSVGRFILDAVLSTGLFVIKKRKTTNTVRLHPDLLGMLQDIINTDLVTIIHPPMIVPPEKHWNINSGGYLMGYRYRGTYTHRNINRKDRENVQDAFDNAPRLREALNKLQEVPYRVNTEILDLVTEARKIGIGIGMPSTKEQPKPTWYLDGIPKEQYSQKEMDEFYQFKFDKRVWYYAEKKRIARLRGLANSIQQCHEFRDEEVLYFPTCLDWRYRVYFKSTLNPQGTDLQKSLLMFAEPKTLGGRGLFWLKVHVATCYGFDKKDFVQRAQWTDEALKALRYMISNPFESELFNGASEPWCFIAATMDLIKALDSPNPLEYKSCIPVAMDATNSGGQHFSALLRDPIGGKLCNLKWDGKDEKEDLYMDVQCRTVAKIEAKYKEAQDSNDKDILGLAEYWLKHPITRTMMKRPTMTFFYAATSSSCTDYIYIAAKEEGYEGTDVYSLFRLCVFISKYVRESIQEALPAATACMKFLGKVARKVPKESALSWRTPLGGLVINKYNTYQKVRVDIRSMGIRCVTVVNRNLHENNRRKSGTGVAPNFIHSLDATHLCMLALDFQGRLLPIHDSVATHACDVDAMHKSIRKSFVELYTQYDPIQDLITRALSEGVDFSKIEIPKKSNLDIKSVLNSPFFFC